MEDVAAVVGMRASAVYVYYPTKAELLMTALQRRNGYLQLAMEEVFADAGDAGDALRRLIDAYTRFAVRRPYLVDLWSPRCATYPSSTRRLCCRRNASTSTSGSDCSKTYVPGT